MCFRIGVHHHILPEVFWRGTNDAHQPVGGIASPPRSKGAAWSDMDAVTNIAITLISTPGVHTGDGVAACDLARRLIVGVKVSSLVDCPVRVSLKTSIENR